MRGESIGPSWEERGLSILRWLHGFKESGGWRSFLLGINLVGIAYGFYYYSDQFRLTPPVFGIFVPDSPLAVLWAELALALYTVGMRSVVVEALAIVFNAKVGVWTAFVLLFYWKTFEIYSFNLNFVLFFAHLGMVLLGGVFLWDFGRDPRWRWGWGVAAAWALLGDFVDYTPFLFTYPTGCALRPMTVPCDSREPILAGFTLLWTLAVLAGTFVASRALGSHRPSRPQL